MKQSRYSEEQVACALRLAESGTPVVDVCRLIGIAEATFYLWKKKYGGLGVSEVRELRQMREENARLKRLVADLTLDKQILQEVIQKKPKASSSTGAGAMDSRPLPGQLSARVRTGRHLSQHLVLPLAGARRVRAPDADP
jgi:putative transposase